MPRNSFHRLRTRCTSVCALALPALFLWPALPAPAQDAGNGVGVSANAAEKIADKHVSVDAEDATLADVITALMRSAGANYTLDPALRQIRVTAHLHDLRLQTTLDVLLRSVTPPMMYRVENGIYSFLPRVAPDTPPLDSTPAPADNPNAGGIRHIQVARVNFIDAAEAARLLGGIPIRTSDGQTYGLVDPNKLGLTGGSSGTAAGTAGGASTAGGAGTPGAPGAGNASATVPANFLDYLWIVNAGAVR